MSLTERQKQILWNRAMKAQARRAERPCRCCDWPTSREDQFCDDCASDGCQPRTSEFPDVGGGS